MKLAILDLQNCSKSVRLVDGSTLVLLDSASLTVRPGEVVALMGRSGSGKSTLLHCLGLLDRFDSGRYTVTGQDAIGLQDREASDLRGRFFGFVLQQFYLLERRSALSNVLSPLQHAPYEESRAMAHRGRSLLERVGLDDRIDAMPSYLSGGEQQRVAVARALIRQPRCILADEPTGSLDAVNGQIVLTLLIELCREHESALVIATHDDSVAAMADRQMVLEAGYLSQR